MLMPMLLEREITSLGLNMPKRCASWITCPSRISEFGVQSMLSLSSTAPAASAPAITNGLVVEPGSKRSKIARLRRCAGLACCASFRLNVG